MVAGATKIIYGEDLLSALPVKDYLKKMGERQTVAKVNADRKEDTLRMMAAAKAGA